MRNATYNPIPREMSLIKTLGDTYIGEEDREGSSVMLVALLRTEKVARSCW